MTASTASSESSGSVEEPAGIETGPAPGGEASPGPGSPAESDAASPSLRAGWPLLWSYARPHRARIVLGVVLGLGATAVSLATPLVTKWVLDSLDGGVDLTRPAVLLLAVLLVGVAAGLAQEVVLGKLAERIVLDARVSLIRRFFRARMEQIQRFRTGELVTRVTSDTVLLRDAATSSVVQLVNGAVALVGTIVLMALLDAPLLLTTLCALAVIAGLLGAVLPRIGRAEKRAQDAVGDLGSSLEGGIRAIRTVKSSRAETREIARVSRMASESARHSIRSVWLSALAGTVAGGGIQLAIIVILGVGAWRVSLGDLEVSTLVAFLLYAFGIAEPVSHLVGSFTQLQSGLAAAARIRETDHLELEDLAARSDAGRAAGARGRGVGPGAGRHDVGPGAQRSGAAPVLALREVTAGYGTAGEPVLRDVALEIPRRGHTALIGPSGAGKTTVFSLLLRLIDPWGGALELDGVPYPRLSIEEVRSRIAYVEQETPVVPGTVRGNVLFRAVEASDAEAWAALDAVRLGQKVRALPGGLDAPVAQTDLSGGERQRLAVARALVRRPDVLLLDEATAQLDGATEAAIHRVIADAARTGSVVTIAHRLSTVVDADRIVVLDAGRIQDSGTHAELLDRNALYREFVAALRIRTDPVAGG